MFSGDKINFTEVTGCDWEEYVVFVIVEGPSCVAYCIKESFKYSHYGGWQGRTYVLLLICLLFYDVSFVIGSGDV